jgi:hypothetical protein
MNVCHKNIKYIQLCYRPDLALSINHQGKFDEHIKLRNPILVKKQKEA